MRVLDYNEKIKKDITKRFFNITSSPKEKINEEEKKFLSFYRNLEKKNPKLFYAYLQNMVISAYVNNAIICKRFPNDCETEQMQVDYFDAFESIEELALELDDDFLLQLAYETYDLCIDKNKFDIRDYYYDVKDYTKKLHKLCPLFLLDMFYYFNSYNTEEVLYTYYSHLSTAESKSIALEDAVCTNVDDLAVLSVNDVENYKCVVSEMIEDYYKYNYYLINNGLVNDDDVKLMISKIEKDLTGLIVDSVNNAFILEEIIRAFITYRTLESEEANHIDRFYKDEQNGTKLNMVRAKTYNIRKNN